MECGGLVEKAALQSGGMTVDTSVLLASRQQGEQAVAGVMTGTCWQYERT